MAGLEDFFVTEGAGGEVGNGGEAGGADGPSRCSPNPFLPGAAGGEAIEGWFKVDGEVRLLRLTAQKIVLFERVKNPLREGEEGLKEVYSFEMKWIKNVQLDRDRPKPAFVIHLQPPKSPVKFWLHCKAFRNSKFGGLPQRADREALFDKFVGFIVAHTAAETFESPVDTKQFEARKGDCVIM